MTTVLGKLSMEGSPRPSVKDAPENDIHSLVVPSYICLAENVGMGAYGIPYVYVYNLL